MTDDPEAPGGTSEPGSQPAPWQQPPPGAPVFHVPAGYPGGPPQAVPLPGAPQPGPARLPDPQQPAQPQWQQPQWQQPQPQWQQPQWQQPAQPPQPAPWQPQQQAWQQPQQQPQWPQPWQQQSQAQPETTPARRLSRRALLIVAAACVVLGALIAVGIIVATRPNNDASTFPSDERSLIGQCVTDSGTGDVTPVDCSKPHDGKVTSLSHTYDGCPGGTVPFTIGSGTDTGCYTKGR